MNEQEHLLSTMKISTRLIAQEALRRGYEIDYFRGGKTATGILLVRVDNEWLVLKSSVGAATRGYGVFVANNKIMMAALLQKFGINTPRFMLYEGDKEAAAEFLQRHKKLVVKPVDTDHGTGVTTSIITQEALEAALVKAEAASKKGALIQEMCEGVDHRLLVVGDRLIAAAYREPAAVQGDGNSSIEALIVRENANPLRGPGHTKPMTLFNTEMARHYLEGKGQSLADVPADGELIQLMGVANLSQGGRAVDVTDSVHPEIAQLAVRATRVAGLGVCGVDVMCRDISLPFDEAAPSIIELNESPGIRMHHFPAEGKPRDVASAILDQAVKEGRRIS